MKIWNFLDYVDQGGVNVIEAWLWGLTMEARLEINTRIQYLAVTPILKRPYTGRLHGDACKELYEIVLAHRRVQYRPLWCYGPNRKDITLLIGATERGGSLDPPTACEIAQTRRAMIGIKGRTCEHSLAEP